VALRCVYTDLDGTLLGKGGSLFHDADGDFTMLPARAMEACHRAGVEIVIKSGRREAQVLEDARIVGSSSYIYEAGCALVMDGEKTILAGDGLEGDDGMTVFDVVREREAPELLFDAFPGRLEYHSPWHDGRELSHLFRGKVDVEEANAILGREGHEDLKLIDNGAIVLGMEGIDIAHAYHLMPVEASKAAAVEFHMRSRGYERDEVIAIGDSIEDLSVAAVVGRFFCPANGPERDPGLRSALAGYDNVTVTEGRNGEGVYEAVVSVLAGGAAQ